MANTNTKNVSVELLGYYDEKLKVWVKSEDSANLTTAKNYTDTEIGKVNDAASTLTDRVTAVEGKASANETAIGVLNGDETTAGSVKKTVADAVAKIVADAPESFDTLKEISDWIASHSESAATMNSAIQTNSSAITALQTLIGSLPEGITATDVVGYIQEAVAAEKARAEGIEGGLDTRLQTVETAIGSTGSIADAIATAKSEAIASAKTYTDTEVKKVDDKAVANAAAIEAINAVDTGILAQAKAYTDTLANGAVATNTAAIAAINNTDTGIAATAKNYADGLNTAMSERVKALEDVPYATEADIDSLFATT